MMSLTYPAALAALLVGIGLYGVLARRNAVLVLIGVELILNAANLLLVTAGARPGAPFAAGSVVTLFVITIAAAEVCVALAVILVMFRRFGHIDLTAVPDLDDTDEVTIDRLEDETGDEEAEDLDDAVASGVVVPAVSPGGALGGGLGAGVSAGAAGPTDLRQGAS